jgi:DNA repair exonuclease SbcCD ATPase subunit
MKILIVILLALLAGLGYKNLQFAHDAKNARQTIDEQREKIKKLEASLDKVSARFKIDADAEKQIVAGIELQLQTEKDKLAGLDFDRNRLRSGGVGGDDPAQYADQIKNEQSVIEDLEGQIKEIRSQNTAINNSRKQELGQTKYEETQAAQQLNYAIQTGRQNLANLQAQKKQLEPQIFNPQVNAQIQQINQQIRDQKTQLQTLNEQTKAYNQQGRNVENSIRNQTGTQLGQLNQNEATLRQRLQLERANLNALKAKQSSASQSRNSQKSAINQIDEAYKTQKQKVDQLQNQLKEEQARLQALTL